MFQVAKRLAKKLSKKASFKNLVGVLSLTKRILVSAIFDPVKLENSLVSKIKQKCIVNVKSLISPQALLSSVVGMISFLYRVFILVQMCYLGYGEVLRIKKYLNYFINFVVVNSRQIKINQQNNRE